MSVEEIKNKITLWHGSIAGIDFPIDVNYSKNLNDFGHGFYLGEMREQAENRVCNYNTGVLYKFTLNIDKQKIYTFTDDVLWALYISYNRNKIDFKNFPKVLKIFDEINKYDIIVGKIANDKIADTYTGFIDGTDTDKVLIESLKLIKYGTQYVIKNQECIDDGNFSLIDEKKLSKEDRKNSLEWGKTLKKSMDDDLQTIRRKYRRDGKFIDEILEEYK